MSMDHICTKILIVNEKVGLLKAQKRRWYIDIIAQINNGRTTQKNLHMYLTTTIKKKKTI